MSAVPTAAAPQAGHEAAGHTVTGFSCPLRPGQRRARARAVLARGRTVVVVAVIGVLLCVALAGAAYAHAAEITADPSAVPPAVPDLTVATSVQQVFDNIRNWLMGILAGLATIFLTLGGVRYLIGAGEPEELAKAKTAFKAAALGFGLAALAPLVVSILESLVA